MKLNAADCQWNSRYYQWSKALITLTLIRDSMRSAYGNSLALQGRALGCSKIGGSMAAEILWPLLTLPWTTWNSSTNNSMRIGYSPLQLITQEKGTCAELFVRVTMMR